MKDRISGKKLNQNLAEVRELLNVNRDLIHTDEYLASLTTLTAVDIAIQNSVVSTRRFPKIKTPKWNGGGPE